MGLRSALGARLVLVPWSRLVIRTSGNTQPTTDRSATTTMDRYLSLQVLRSIPCPRRT